MIKFIVFDFDGVFTDGKFYFDNNDNVKKCYNGKDAYSLKIIKNYNIKCGIITNDKIISIKHAPHIFERLDKVSLGSDNPKLEILDTWLDEYGFTYQDVAYIGDDLPDIPVLKKVGFSACPNDSVEEVKVVSQYICKNKGGDGAVREFVDLIIKNNLLELKAEKEDDIKVNNDGKITAVIPVRKGSIRCKNKNIRNFGDTNLLKLKIETLKKVKGIDRILVSSECDIMLKIATDLGVDTHKREKQYLGLCPPKILFPHLASLISTPIMMYVQVTTPLVSLLSYNNMIETWHKFKNINDCVVSSGELQEFIWDKNKPINYDIKNHPMSQDLPKYNCLNFACHIINVENVRKYNNVIGVNPYFYKLNMVENIDIDYPSQYLISEFIHLNNLNLDTCKLVLDIKKDKIALLDCTIRDGGYLNNWDFSSEQILDCYKAVTEAGYEYFEIGFKRNKISELDSKGLWYYCLESDINNTIGDYIGCKINVMVEPLKNDVSIKNFIPKDKSKISMVRLLTKTNVSQKKVIDLANELINYGYEVCINLSGANLMNDNEIKIIASEFHDVKIKALYLADTYGGFNTYNVPIQLHKFYSEFEKYNSNISFGFHCHNNNEDALSKTKTAIYHGCTMIDSCIGGLGRGAGNLKSEQLMSYLYKDNAEYIKKITPLIVYFDKHILSKTKYQQNHHIQSHPYYMISSVISLHPNYITEILSMNTNVINDIELIVKLDKYTKQNIERNYDKMLITNIIKN
jgi:YrbI family 3-deoxy-D-manno-octulosonate 8-phosphate phosphatase